MSTIFEKLARRFDQWMDRLVIPDDRYVCAGCDDRFMTRSHGVEHVLRCHPEYEGVMVYEDINEHLVGAAA